MPMQFQHASILVVDDMAPMLEIVCAVLQEFGFKRIVRANSAEKAFDRLVETRPDIVLTDWQMEPTDGLALVRRIRNDPETPNRFVPVIMMTGYSHRMRVEEARDAGITEFLVKPFKAKDLYVRLEQLVERPRGFVEMDDFFGPDRRRRKKDSVESDRREKPT